MQSFVFLLLLCTGVLAASPWSTFGSMGPIFGPFGPLSLCCHRWRRDADTDRVVALELRPAASRVIFECEPDAVLPVAVRVTYDQEPKGFFQPLKLLDDNRFAVDLDPVVPGTSLSAVLEFTLPVPLCQPVTVGN